MREGRVNMKVRECMKKWVSRASAVTLSVLMCAALAAPVRAAEPETVSSSAEAGQTVDSPSDSEKPFTITFQTENGKILKSWKAGNDDTWGPAGTISVRSAYYAGEVDYDIVSINGTPADASSAELQVGASEKFSGDLTVVYKQHTDTSSSSASGSITYYCINEEDGSQLFTFTSDSQSIPGTLKIGNKTYVRDPGKKNDNDDTSRYNLYYKLKEDTNTSYTVKVQYVDEDGNVISTRSFYVNGKDHTFIAPNEFSVTAGDGTTTYYKAAGKTTIKHKVSDTTRTYTVTYKKLTAEDGDSYTWYILLYSSQTNTCIDTRTVEVSPNAEASFTPEKSITVDGKKYTINKAFDKEFTHEYSNSNHTTYIYYDPEGYSNSSDVQTKTINIRYVNIADGSVLQSHTQEVTSEGDTTITFPDSFDQDGVHYLKVQGQASSISYNFYSPKITYTVYYYDENNTQFRTAVITREQVEEITVNDGTTVYTVIPGITRTVVNYTDNGVSTVVATEDATGEQIPEASTGSNANGDNTVSSTSGTNGTGTTGNGGTTANGNEDTQDTTIDGVQADDIQTPQSNIWLDSKADNSSTVKTTALLIIGLAAVAACIFATIMLIRRRKKGNR